MRTLLLLVSLVAAAHAHADHPIVTISRHHKADMFTAEGSSCSKDICVGSSSGTAGASDGTDCTCQCLPNLPVFRDDLNICIDDIHECPLAPFVSASTAQRIPFVFLPLKGQIVYPSAEISFAGTTTPICVVSGAQFLTRGGWVDLHNNSYTEPPFRLFRDEGRTFLQWLGETDLRLNMEGRLMLVHLMCKDVGGESDFHSKGIFTPCVAFRIAGTPSVREVVFAADAHAAAGNDGRGLSVSEYIAIAVCSILLGLIYVASVFLYLHMRRRRGRGSSKADSRDLNQIATHIEEGIVKNNPLLHNSNNDTGSYLSDSASCCSDTDNVSDDDVSPPSDLENSRMLQHNVQVTSAMVHSCGIQFSLQPDEPLQTQDSTSIERLPEENVSIVETPEGREDRPETVRAITNGATARRKLYFNPAYFEPELLVAPPPAAIEFLTKIREVIAIAKHKMMAKRFSPTLMGIPEEDLLRPPSTSTGTVSLKRENGRKRGSGCSGCPGCKLPAMRRSCQACNSPSESKQNSIRRWLEDVPVSSQPPRVPTPPRSVPQSNERVRTPQKGKAPAIPKALDNSEKKSAGKDSKDLNGNKKIKSPPPPPMIVTANEINLKNNKKLPSVLSKCKTKAPLPAANKLPAPCPPPPPPPPPMPSPVKNETNEKPIKKPVLIGEPGVKKQLMDAVIKEMVGQRVLESTVLKKAANRSPEEQRKLTGEEYEADSLERSFREQSNKGMSTPSDYGDASQPSPSLSSALPMEEELTMRNEIFNKHTGNKTISKLKLDTGPPKEQHKTPEDNEYEIIVMNPNAAADGTTNDDVKLYTLPELLSHSDGYSLVSEVYVNDGYSFSSASSSPSNTSGGESAQIRYSEKQGQLTIQVKDSPDNYLHVPDESDSFEPDTLDRKPNRIKTEDIALSPCNTRRYIENYADSLERPAQILLRTTGSFRSDSLSQTGSDDLSHIFTPSPLTRAFGSLREIYEARTQHRCDIDNISLVGSTRSLNSELDYNHSLSWKRRYGTGARLNPKAKQARRQRPPTPPGTKDVCHKPSPPDVVPPLPPKMSALYEDPPPPRPLYTVDMIPPLPPRTIKPPLPPKNAAGRSTSQKRAISDHARRPLPMLPSPANKFQQSVLVPESRDLETISNLSGASVDSLNSSDYEAFYMAPVTGNEDAEGSHTLGHRLERSLQNKLDQLNSQFIMQQPQSKATRTGERPRNKSTSDGDTVPEARRTTARGVVKHMRDKNSDSIKKTWRRMVQKSVPHKPEDSGYLSTDSNESHSRRLPSGPGMGSVSETDESETCDGASESGAESIATDSFFFGSFRGSTVVTESVDSGVGSDLLARTISNPSRLLEEGGSSSDSENVSFVTVLPPGSGRHGRSLRC